MSTRAPHLSPLLVVTALASAGAGIVHAAAAPEHADWAASVAFFAGLAVFQIGWAAYLLALRPGPRALALGATVNLLALGIWAVSRLSGLPFGPHRGEAEAAARADVIAAVLGLIVVLGAVGIARHRESLPVARLRSAVSVSAGGLAVSALAVFALTGISGHAHPAGGGHDHAAPLEMQPAASTSDLAPPVAAETEAPHADDGHGH